jgi:HEAT repeat protein
VSEPNQPKIMEYSLRGLIKLIKAVQYYPPSHPTLKAAVAECLGNFAPLFAAGDNCICTVRKEGFFLGDSPVGRQNPILGKLAPFLFARRIHTLLLQPDLSGEDLRGFARCLTLEPRELLKLGGIQEVMAKARISTIWVNEIDLAKILSRKDEIEAEKRAHPEAEEEEQPEPKEAGAAEEIAVGAEERNIARVLRELQQETVDQRYRYLLQELTPLIHLNLTDTARPLVLDALTLLASNAGDPKLSPTRKEQSAAALAQLATEDILDFLVTILCSKSIGDEGTLAEEDKELVLGILVALQGKLVVWRLMDYLAAESDSRVRRVLTEALLRQGSAAIPALLEHLGDERWYVVRNAVAILGELRDQEAVSSLQPLLRHKDVRVSRETIRSLTKIGGPTAVDFLLRIVGEGEEKLRRQALLSLGAMKNPAAVPTLLQLVTEPDPMQKRVEVKKEALKALGEIGSDQAVPVLVQILGQRKFWLRSRQDELRAAAAQALGEIGAPSAAEPLQAATDDRAAIVARAATQALKQIKRGE